MSPRNLGALFCGIAAVALLVAGFMPWFTMDNGGDEDELGFSARSDRRSWDDEEDERRRWNEDLRGNFGLVSGELCLRMKCKSAKYTGAPGMADDAFAWLGRATLATALSAVALLIATALAARTQRRPILRGWAVTVAAAAAGLGAAFASTQTLEGIAGYVERGMGLGAVIIGAGLAGLGAAWPWSSPEPGERGGTELAKRVAMAMAVAGLAGVAWLTLSQHVWWQSGRSLDVLQVSPLGVEVCEGDDCQLAGPLGATSGLRMLACLTSLCAAALIAPAFGTASRVARGIAPGAWAYSAALLGWLGLGAGVATWLSYPSSEIMTVSWGLPVFAVAMAGTGAAAVVSVLLFRTKDDEAAASVPGARPAAAATAVVAAGGVAPGAKPVLAPLGPPIPKPVDAPAVLGDAETVSPYAPKPAAGSPYAPKPAAEPAKPAPEPASPYAPKPAAEPASPYAPKPAAEPASPYAPKPAAEPAKPAPEPVSPYAPRPSVAVQPAPQAQAQARPTGPSAAAQLAKKTSPMCPTCRVATLWHGKRGAWWCSTCKQTV